jgi:hypothetical protein
VTLFLSFHAFPLEKWKRSDSCTVVPFKNADVEEQMKHFRRKKPTWGWTVQQVLHKTRTIDARFQM